MEDPESQVQENPETEAELGNDCTRFDKAIKELKDLCSQLHYAADYCKKSFLNAQLEEKTMVVENTRDYLCRAVVTVVDHLGNVSANLDGLLLKDHAVSETEFRINTLKERLDTCQQYSHKVSLARLHWYANFPRHNPRYIFPPLQNLGRSQEVARKFVSPLATGRDSEHELERMDVPLFLYTCNHRPSSSVGSSIGIDCDSCASALPVRDGLCTTRKIKNPSFHLEETHKLKRRMLNWKLVHNNDILSVIRRRRRRAN
ncbi:hypothetical protein NMG60_11021882 [Bertholletia excelsa]